MKPNFPPASDAPEMPPTAELSEAPEVAESKPVNEDRVPLKALEMPDDKEQMTPPAVGDQVEYTCTGKVTAIEGEQVVVARESCNGQPLEPDADDAGGPGDADGDEMAGLEAMAGNTTL